ncbi:histidinol-phosphate transaminase [Rubellicoccus peritrichatus]|uniref:Histidinol-phosphate aminotransferase n=1 Tax=Rubellicoccus peritrichatus TaxID=3080537 RepID=A0AAQ3L7Y2_9BACT|nr:histidinol-phosphate transaminase [Puniceicoccus sp. CR14]WOO41309.1 histidinol-phosphate transaminase [Puniceicoccus sp. CR14]
MKYTELVRPEILKQPVYEPGKPIEYVAREYGLDPDNILKLASNENPLGASPLGIEAAHSALAQSHLYPDGGCYALRHKLAERFSLQPEQFVIGNGSNEIMVLLCHALLRPGDEAVMGAQSFIAFKLSVLLAGATPVEVPMPDMRHDLEAMADAVTEKTRMVYLPSPNNPTGDTHSQEAIECLIERLPDNVVFLFDEAYAEYLEVAPDLRPLIEKGHKVVCCRTFSKIYGLAAFRLGYAYGSAELMGLLNRIRQPFNVNAIGQAAALAALDDKDHVARSRKVNQQGQAQLTELFKRLGLDFVPSEANFLLLRVRNGKDAFEVLQKHGIIVRPLGGYGLSDWVRVTVGTELENARLGQCLEQIAQGPEAPVFFHQTTAQ